MAIDIRAIKIMLDTNIPGKGPVPFTKSMLYNPVLKTMTRFNEYPYFTMDIEFPEGYLTQLPYEEQVAFFFEKLQMERVLRKYVKPSELVKTNQETSLEFPVEKTKKLGEKKEKDKVKGEEKTDRRERDKKIEQAERANKNIMILLRLLFPTKYPVANNIFTSYTSVIKKSPEFTLKFTDFLPSFLKQKLFKSPRDFVS
jgi:hypothetical protein